jgi:hypothetical protein
MTSVYHLLFVGEVAPNFSLAVILRSKATKDLFVAI